MHGPIRYTFYQRAGREQERDERATHVPAGRPKSLALSEIPAEREWVTVQGDEPGKKRIDFSE